MKEKEIKIYPEMVRKIAEQKPQYREALELLFPQIFDGQKLEWKIGSIIKRQPNPNNYYALFKWNGEVRLLNVTYNTFWNPQRNLKVHELMDPLKETLTNDEFRKLTGIREISQFRIIKP